MNFLLLFLLASQLAADSARAAWKEEAATTHSYSSSIVPSSLRSLRDDDGRITTGITGQYNIIFDEDDGSYIPIIDLADGTLYILENLPDDFQASDLPSGAQITLPEEAVFSSGGSIDMKGLSLIFTGTEELVSQMQTVLPKKDMFGKKSVLFVKVKFNNGVETTVDVDKVSREFHQQNNPFDDCSYNKLEIKPAKDRTGNGAKIANGVVNIDVDIECECCKQGQKCKVKDGVAYVNAAVKALNAAFGVSSPKDELANYLAFFMPRGVHPTAVALGVPDWRTLYSGYTPSQSQVLVVAHELGRNVAKCLKHVVVSCCIS